MSKTKRKLTLVALLWFFYVLSFTDIPVGISWYVLVAVVFMTVAIVGV